MMRTIFIFFSLLSSVLLAHGKVSVLEWAEKITPALRNTAMPELGDSPVEKILEKYYKKRTGGQENWDKIESVILTGELKTKDSKLALNAYQKKPTFIKLVLSNKEVHDSITLSYDGKVAWKQMGSRAEPENMDDTEARRFIHNARFDNYLFYPFAEGKRISHVATVPTEGAICHQMRVVLDTGYQVDYFFDIRTFLEIKVVNTDLRSGAVSSIIYKDYDLEQPIPIAKKVKSFEEGEWVSTLLLDNIKLNSGIMPWMFSRPE